MRREFVKGQTGFTLIELLAVMAILGILAGLVAGTVVGLGSRSQSTRLDGDLNSISKSANSFFLEAFPEVYPVETVTTNASGTPVSGTQTLPGSVISGIKIIDFKAGLPQDPSRVFIPDFLTTLPDSSALVSWRIDENSGNVFFAQDGSPLIKPSNNRLDISADTGTADTNDDHVFTLSMDQNEASPEVIEIGIPAGYTLGGGSANEGTFVGELQVVLATDNPFDSGNEVFFGGVIVTTEKANGDPNPDEWALLVDYNFNSSSVAVKTDSEAYRKHTIDVVRPGGTSGGTLTINFARGSDPEENESTETWTLTLFGTTTDKLTATNINIPSGETADSSDDGFASKSGLTVDTSVLAVVPAITSLSEVSLLKNPSAGVHRWSAEEHSTIDPVVGETLFFNDLPGRNGVLVK